MGLFKWLFYLLVFAAVAWFATSVPLGKRTLWGHLVAIGRTKEAKDLAEGTEEEARRIAEKMREELARDGGAQTLEGHDHDPTPAEREKAVEQLRQRRDEQRADGRAIEPQRLPPRRLQKDRER